MFKQERIGQFRNELNLIKSGDVKIFTTLGLLQAPKYWWTQESSKRHHYKDERKKGGRVKHAKRCAKLAYCIAEALEISAIDTDLLVSASLLHDICVRGMSDEPSSSRAFFEHPVWVRGKLERLIEDYPRSTEYFVWLEQLLGLIETHMGKWGPIQPRTDLEKLFHLVDVIASRDFVKIEV